MSKEGNTQKGGQIQNDPFKTPEVVQWEEEKQQLSPASWQFASSGDEVIPSPMPCPLPANRQGVKDIIKSHNKRIMESNKDAAHKKLSYENLKQYNLEMEKKFKEDQKNAKIAQNAVTKLKELKEYLEQVRDRKERIPPEVIQAMKKFLPSKALDKVEEIQARFGEKYEKKDELEKKVKQYKEDIEALKVRKVDMERKIAKQQKKARFLYNELTDMNGRIRIYARMRPPLKAEKARGDEMARIEVDSSKAVMRVSSEPGALNSKEETKSKGKEWQSYRYNGVYGVESSQEEIFDEVKDMIVSAVYGESVTIFAYGQTGSGKTFTMEGGDSISNEKEQGIIPRAFNTIFDVVQKDGHYEYELEASIMEIYLKEIRDLVNPQNVMKQTDAKFYKFKAERVQVTSKEDIRGVLNKMKENRKVASTSCNERSSRSHSIFQLYITSHEKPGDGQEKRAKKEGVLNLIDLAGSERVQQSKVQGVQLKEAMAINSSLMSLGQVIEALVRGDDHVPFKNSMLTQLLEKYLSQRGKIAMFVNISPLFFNLKESISTLKFGSKAGEAQLKKTKHEAISDSDSDISHDIEL